MNEPHAAQQVLDDLLTRLQWCSAGPDKAYGEVEGSPVTMTVLGAEPLALLLGFKIQALHPSHIALPDDIQSLVLHDKAEVSLEQGIAWLSLDDLQGETGETIAGLITSFARGLADANVRLPEGCIQCRSVDDVRLVYWDGRCTRLCDECRGRVADDQVQREAELNRPSAWFALALPLMFLYVSCAWTLLWWLGDRILVWTNTDIIVLRTVEFVVLVVVLAAIAGVTGYPIGVFLRRSGIPGRTHWLASFATVLAACAVGEFLYVAIVVYRLTGVIDLPLTAEMVVPFIRGYHPSWLVSKLVVAGAISLGCYGGAQWRTAQVQL